MDIEKIENHIKILINKHSMLENELEKLLKENPYNQFKIENVKKEKLKVKDELSRLHRTRHDLMNDIGWE